MNTESRLAAYLDDATLRRRAPHFGYVVKKSRHRGDISWGCGGYMLLQGESWIIVVGGPDYDASLREVADFLDRLAGKNGPH